MFLREIIKMTDKIQHHDQYPFNIPTIRSLDRLSFNKNVTFFVGENGSGKSTLLEAIAYQCGFNTGGGSRNNQYDLESSEARLGDCIRLSWMPKVNQGFFLKAETFYSFASHIDKLAEEDPSLYRYYGGKSLHEQSHGEAFVSLFKNRFGQRGIYILDEPEAALSPQRQILFLSIIHELQKNAQLIIATHSPILMGYPNADIYNFDSIPVTRIGYKETEHYQVTRRFLENREFYLTEILEE
ncbi:AAA family ATPase [Paenibacillus segetis]|uniref:ATPase AAA n=1 Tax=Paenibacillus segetis TaxID=1325360 RepID=A0ABQ1YD34_9BACL|nr:AAA family ATPase [Paenibacillus segetis]GGH19970.1 ATPase AAA [Paenibacillus segetis]